MEALALYRKHRPQKFKDVLGQDQVVKVLESSLKDNKISHAYLFVGSRGTGKTSVARIFAREIGVSENDLYEIDAASNRGIDDIKALRDGVRVLPFESKHKIYIIDEVHMLSKDAWGALLKTLEEPPKHVVFILATTEFDKVPETIISRCQMFVFRKAGEMILKKMLLDVAKEEGYTLEKEAAELLAILADGSFRDALGGLQKVLNFSENKKIERELVEKVMGAPKNVLVDDFLEAIVKKNLESGIKITRQAAKENLEMKLYLKLIIQKIRIAIILRYAPKLEEEMASDLSQRELEFLKKIVKEDKEGMLRSRTLSILLEAYTDIENAFIPELPLELALVEILNKDSN